MNTEDFVTYSQALALKKLGFREECLFAYNAEGIFCPNFTFDNDGEKTTTYNLYYSENKSNSFREVCDAPTLAQAQKWLRKHKHYSIEVSLDKNHTPLWQSFVVRLSDVKNIKNVIFCASYEEALSAGITECLKILEI